MVHSRSMFAAILATSFECSFAAPINAAFSAAGGVQRNVPAAFPQISGSSANSADPRNVSGPPYAALGSSPAEVDAKLPRDISVMVHKNQDAAVNCYLDKGRRSREDSNYSGFSLEPHDLLCGVMLPGPSDVLNGPVRRAEDGPLKQKKKVHFAEEVVTGTSQTPPPIDIEDTPEQITLRKHQEESHAFNEELKRLYANTSPPRGRPPGLLFYRPAKVTKVTKPRPKSPSSKSLTRPPGKSDQK